MVVSGGVWGRRRGLDPVAREGGAFHKLAGLWAGAALGVDSGIWKRLCLKHPRGCLGRKGVGKVSRARN